ncbi:outer membrane receptor protein involved in Fe transport [Xanthomonas translucens]|nr:outer membrane receptor protein involved in Fe transport [Xanthomonas campestris]
MQVLPVPWNTTAGVDVNNLFDRDSPAVLSAVANSLDSASVFPAVNAAPLHPALLIGRAA